MIIIDSASTPCFFAKISASSSENEPGYLQPYLKESLILFKTFFEGPYGFSFELSLTTDSNLRGRKFSISFAERERFGVNTNPPIPTEALSQSLLYCIFMNF